MSYYEKISVWLAVAAFITSLFSVIWPIIHEQIQRRPRISIFLEEETSRVIPSLTIPSIATYDYDKKGLELNVILQNTGTHRLSVVSMETALEMIESKSQLFYSG